MATAGHVARQPMGEPERGLVNRTERDATGPKKSPIYRVTYLAPRVTRSASSPLNMTHHFKIPHQPDAKLMLRIGLHSGKPSTRS